VIVIVVDYLGLNLVKIVPPSDPQGQVIIRNVLGKEILSTETMNLQGTALEVITPKEKGTYMLKEFEIPWSHLESNYVLNYYPEESMVGILGITEEDQLLVVSRDFEISYRTTPEVRSASSAFSLERTVKIGVSTFTVTLYIWRMSY